MKYVIIAMLIVSFLAGGYIGSKFSTRTDLRTVTSPATVKTIIQTKVVERLKDGSVIERVVLETKDEVKPSPQPKTQYRLGALVPLASELKLPTVSASRRLFGNLWLDAQFDIRHKEILGGFSYEF